MSQPQSRSVVTTGTVRGPGSLISRADQTLATALSGGSRGTGGGGSMLPQKQTQTYTHTIKEYEEEEEEERAAADQHQERLHGLGIRTTVKKPTVPTVPPQERYQQQAPLVPLRPPPTTKQTTTSKDDDGDGDRGAQKQEQEQEKDRQSTIGDEDIEALVNEVIADSSTGTRRFELRGTGIDEEESETSREIVDDLREFKSIATEFVVKEFFSTEETLFNFLRLVYTTFVRALAYYRKQRFILDEKHLFFVYKGGNILRIVSNEFLLELPKSATRQIDDFYAPFFKRSDADFSIYLHPDTKDYDEVYHELGLLAYVLQARIRKVFFHDLTRYFDFFRYNAEFKSKVMRRYVDRFNASVSVTDEESPFYGREFVDFVLPGASVLPGREYQPKEEAARFFLDDRFGADVRALGMVKISRRYASFLPITYNTALEFVTGADNERRVQFTLVRTKAMFNLYGAAPPTPAPNPAPGAAATEAAKYANVGGELIDVSIPHRLDTNLPHFFEHLDDYINEFHLRYGDEVFTFQSYALRYLIEDLETILFKFNSFPWDDTKYAKRINRLFYLYFVDIFVHLDSSESRVEVLQDLHQNVFRPLATIHTRADVSLAHQKIEQFLSKYGDQGLYVNNLLRLLRDLLDKLGENDLDQMHEMSILLSENSERVASAVANVRQYCKSDGNVNPEHIYSVGMDSLQ